MSRKESFLLSFEGYLKIFAVFQNVYIFIPRFLPEPLAMFCGNLCHSALVASDHSATVYTFPSGAFLGSFSFTDHFSKPVPSQALRVTLLMYTPHISSRFSSTLKMAGARFLRNFLNK